MRKMLTVPAAIRIRLNRTTTARLPRHQRTIACIWRISPRGGRGAARGVDQLPTSQSTAGAGACDRLAELGDAADHALGLGELVGVAGAEPGHAERDVLGEPAPALQAGGQVVADDDAEPVQVLAVDQLAGLVAAALAGRGHHAVG